MNFDLNNQSYESWLQHKLYQHQSKSQFSYLIKPNKKEYKYIPMPPPNITGKLHMGHALFLTIQDSLTRYYKNYGHETLWLPGLDHAGLATYDKITAYQKKTKKRYEESASFIESSHRDIILSQIQKMGALPDWDMLKYTLDKDYQEFILNILKQLCSQGMILFKDEQYYLDLSSLAKELSEDLKNNQFKIIPNYEIKNLLPFLDKIEPWCISRQIPWGTKLCLKNEKGKAQFDESYAGTDSLDTWFNSSFWSIATIINKPDLMEKFYPADLIETGSDILFFWCAKMLMMSNYLYKNQASLGIKIKEKYCFNTIYLHGIIRDKNGEKFSKSLGNGIDPLDMIKIYGADATRLFLITRTGPSEDIIFDEKDLMIYKKFINKIYQSARFFSMYASKANLDKIGPDKELIAPDTKANIIAIQEKFCAYMNNLNFLEASRYIHSTFKEYFCDKWIEENKMDIQALNSEKIYEGILILDQFLAMLNPFCPFITYEIKKEFFDTMQ